MLKQTGFKFVVFSIHGDNNPFVVSEMYAAFESYGLTKPTRCIGSYNGTVENSWITTTETFDKMWCTEWAGRNWFDEESFMLFSECNKQYASLFFPDPRNNPRNKDGHTTVGTIPTALSEYMMPLGSLHNVTREQAKAEGNWTYRCDTKKWFITKHESPDRVPPPSGHVSKEQRAKVDKWLAAALSTISSSPPLPLQ